MKNTAYNYKVIILIVLAVLAVLLLSFTLFGRRQEPTEDTAVSLPTPSQEPGVDNQPINQPPPTDDTAELNPPIEAVPIVEGLTCQTNRRSELPVLELDELLQNVADCRFGDRVYRRYLKIEFEEALLRTLDYLVAQAEDSDQTLAQYCRNQEFQTILNNAQQLLLITPTYVFYSQTAEDKEVLRGLLSPDFDLSERIDVCQQITT